MSDQTPEVPVKAPRAPKTAAPEGNDVQLPSPALVDPLPSPALVDPLVEQEAAAQAAGFTTRVVGTTSPQLRVDY